MAQQRGGDRARDGACVVRLWEGEIAQPHLAILFFFFLFTLSDKLVIFIYLFRICHCRDRTKVK